MTSYIVRRNAYCACIANPSDKQTYAYPLSRYACNRFRHDVVWPAALAGPPIRVSVCPPILIPIKHHGIHALFHQQQQQSQSLCICISFKDRFLLFFFKKSLFGLPQRTSKHHLYLFKTQEERKEEVVQLVAWQCRSGVACPKCEHPVPRSQEVVFKYIYGITSRQEHPHYFRLNTTLYRT